MERNNNDILLLDGKCGLCNRLALFIAAHMSSHKKIKFLPIDSNDARNVISRIHKINGVNRTETFLSLEQLLNQKESLLSSIDLS